MKFFIAVNAVITFVYQTMESYALQKEQKEIYMPAITQILARVFPETR